MGKDRFSEQAADYAAFRPTYPAEWYTWLLQQVSTRQQAWDVGTGNGQVACKLANHFDHVWATDLSQKQLDQAPRHPNVQYRQALAHMFPGHEHSCQLITVAQALHWFDLDTFYTAAAKALTSGGVLAVWGYGLPQLSDPTLQQAFTTWYHEDLGPYWDTERQHVEDHYQKLPFPYQAIAGPLFDMEYTWTLDQWFGYLQSWSGVRNYIHQRGADPIKLLKDNFFPPTNSVLEVKFPLFYKVGHAN